MLISFYNRVIIYSVFIFLFSFLLCLNTSFNYSSGVSVITFFSYIFIIYGSLNKDESYYSSCRLLLTVFIYTLLILCLFWTISLMYDGDTYLFTKTDAFLYERISMRAIQMPFLESVIYIFSKYSFDDCGAFLVMIPILKIISNKLFLNFVYILMGVITAQAVFNIGRRIMDNKYAYLAALTFSTASFTIYFHGTFLKETGFIMFITLLFNSLYKYIERENVKSLLLVVLYSVIICLFRPAVTAIIWLGIITYFFLANKGSSRLLIVISILFVCIISFASIITIMNRYTANGDFSYLISSLGENERTKGISKNFLYGLMFVISLTGPYPKILCTIDNYVTACYGPGLLFKLFLTIPFYYAVWKIIKEKYIHLIPLVSFVIIECVLAAVTRKAFEVRITYPHLAMYFLISYWSFYITKDSEKEIGVISKLCKWFFPIILILCVTYVVRYDY